MPPPAQSAEAKNFLQNPRGVREQIRVIFKICTQVYRLYRLYFIVVSAPQHHFKVKLYFRIH